MPISFPTKARVPMQAVGGVGGHLVSRVESSCPSEGRGVLFFPSSIRPFRPRPLFYHRRGVFVWGVEGTKGGGHFTSQTFSHFSCPLCALYHVKGGYFVVLRVFHVCVPFATGGVLWVSVWVFIWEGFRSDPCDSSPGRGLGSFNVVVGIIFFSAISWQVRP